MLIKCKQCNLFLPQSTYSTSQLRKKDIHDTKCKICVAYRWEYPGDVNIEDLLRYSKVARKSVQNRKVQERMLRMLPLVCGKSLRKMKTVLFQIFTILPDEVSELIFDFDDEQESIESVQLWTYRRGYFYCRP